MKHAAPRRFGRNAAKAWVAAGIALCGSLGTAMGTTWALTPAEALGAAGTTLAAFAAVYWTDNGKGVHDQPDRYVTGR